MHKLFFEIHKDLPREGAGRYKYTKKAFELIPQIKNPNILDIGCGPGDQTIQLAHLSKGTVTGIDTHQPYLDVLSKKIKDNRLEDKVKAVNKSMNELDYQNERFDIIWAEGSIFIIGFEKGLRDWYQFIKKDGYLAVHEMTWLKDNPPKEISDFWEKVYPEISTIENNIDIIKKCKYKLLNYFPLPEDAWWEFYYNPLEKRINKLMKKYIDDKDALEYFESEKEEIDLFRKYSQWYGSVFYIMQK